MQTQALNNISGRKKPMSYIFLNRDSNQGKLICKTACAWMWQGVPVPRNA